ncbi:MAG: hypothetical protein A3K66_01250 [Euryarchaeota archaeon RBG_16_67_27]|nr:MAG: hypothetical protein A3K66_01250 [Euryarchaeota archaeon RBG_16_67_27]
MYQGEQTLLETRPTRLISFKYYVLFVLAEALALILFADLVPQIQNAVGTISILGWSLGTILSVVLAALGLLSLVTAELKRASTHYIITDNKIIRRDGILNKRTMMVPYTQLEKVDLNQSLLQRVLRIGTLNIDTGDDSITIDMVPSPTKVQDLLSQRMGRRAFQR